MADTHAGLIFRPDAEIFARGDPDGLTAMRRHDLDGPTVANLGAG